MATYDFPEELCAQMANFGLQKAGLQFRGIFNGDLQAVDLNGERWMMSLTTPPKLSRAAGALEAFANLISGGINKVRMHHPQRLVPLGTLRGSPTLQVTTAVGDREAVLTVASGATLKAGDMLGIGAHLLQVAQDCAASGTTLEVPFVNRFRDVVNSGAAVTWDQPTTLFVCSAMLNMASHKPGFVEGLALDFDEAWD